MHSKEQVKPKLEPKPAPKKEDTLHEQAEKTVNKVSAFFKNAFQKFEDSFKQEESKVPPPAKNNNPYVQAGVPAKQVKND